MKKIVSFFLLFNVLCCFVLNAQSLEKSDRKYSIEALQEDFRVLRSSLEEGHAGLYRYNSKQEFDRYFDSLYACIIHEQTETEFMRFLTPLIYKIHCVHSWVSNPDTYKESNSYFPLPIKIIDNKMYADCDYDGVKFGSELVAINGEKTQNILEKLYITQSTDGFNQTFLPRILEYSFHSRYKQHISDTNSYTMLIKAPLSSEIVQIKTTGVTKDSLRAIFKTRHLNLKYKNAPALSYNFQNDSTVLLNIETFDGTLIKNDKIDYDTYLKAFFKELDEKNVKNLIIDLRRNPGGTSAYNPGLFSYLTSKPFDVFASVQINTITPSFLRYTQFAGQEKQLMAEWKKQFKTQNKEGKYETVMEAANVPKKNNFKGNVYLLVSGLTVSTAARFTDVFSVNRRGVIIGEEPGGGYFGNNGGVHAVLTVPNTKLKFDVPLFKMIMAGALNKAWEGHGVQPDYSVHSTITDYENGRDGELEFILDLIKKK